VKIDEKFDHLPIFPCPFGDKGLPHNSGQEDLVTDSIRQNDYPIFFLLKQFSFNVSNHPLPQMSKVKLQNF
jgi:hypothetical protein